MTQLKTRRSRQTGSAPTAAPAVECLGCGALHALIDRITLAAEQIESALPCPEPRGAGPDWTANPDGIPDTEEK